MTNATIFPTITTVDVSRGAPMGRSAWGADTDGPAMLFKVPLDNGGYDAGGAYFGLPDNLWCLTDGNDFRRFFRAGSQLSAYQQAQTQTDAPVEVDVLTTMLAGYLNAMLAAEVIETEDRDSEYYDLTFTEAMFGISTLAPEVIEQAKADCAEFLEKAKQFLPAKADYDDVGFNFFMTRQGHGVGFWDSPKLWGGETKADKLNDIARKFRELCPYLGDDEVIHCD